MALFWAAFRSDSVSLLRFPFLSLVNVFSSRMPLVSFLNVLLLLFTPLRVFTQALADSFSLEFE